MFSKIKHDRQLTAYKTIQMNTSIYLLRRNKEVIRTVQHREKGQFSENFSKACPEQHAVRILYVRRRFIRVFCLLPWKQWLNLAVNTYKYSKYSNRDKLNCTRMLFRHMMLPWRYCEVCPRLHLIYYTYVNIHSMTVVKFYHILPLPICTYIRMYLQSK